MKVAYLSGAQGSLGNHDCRFLRSLVSKGYETYLITFHPDDISDDVKGIEELKIIHVKPKILRKFQRYFYFTRIFRFNKIVNLIKPDVIISVNTWNNGFLASFSSFHPHICIPMGSDIMIHPYQYFLCRFFNKYALKRTDLIAPDCLRVKELIMDEYGIPEEKIFIFFWGVDLNMFYKGADRCKIRDKMGWGDKKIIIMNRHFEEVYAVTDFVGSLPYILEKREDVRVFLIGDGRLRNEILEKINKYDLHEYVYAPGRVSRGEMVEYLNNADLYVSSSLSDGTSVSLLEAMACELPVVCTEIPSNREWIKDGYNGYLVPIKNPEQLAEHILTLLSDEEQMKIMGKRNLEIVSERGSWGANINLFDSKIRNTATYAKNKS